MNLLKGGIQHADKITTVSPTYAQEIRTEQFGHGLQGSLTYRGADLLGILNGIDEASWDPQKDPALPCPIHPDSPQSGKEACKESLLAEMNLPASPDAPLFGVVSRLYRQKGLDLLIECLPSLLSESNANFVILGSGAKEEEEAFRQLAGKFPDRIAVFIGFDDGLALKNFCRKRLLSHAQSIRTLWFGSTLRDALRVPPNRPQNGWSGRHHRPLFAFHRLSQRVSI